MSLGTPIEVAAKLNDLQRRSRVPLLASADLEPGLGRLEGGLFVRERSQRRRRGRRPATRARRRLVGGWCELVESGRRGERLESGRWLGGRSAGPGGSPRSRLLERRRWPVRRGFVRRGRGGRWGLRCTGACSAGAGRCRGLDRRLGLKVARRLTAALAGGPGHEVFQSPGTGTRPTLTTVGSSGRRCSASVSALVKGSMASTLVAHLGPTRGCRA